MNVLRFRIKLDEHTLLTALEGDPNSAVSLLYIPGSVLRGALIGLYKQLSKHLGFPVFSIEDPFIQSLFFNGNTRYLNAYPVHDDKRALPTRKSWRKEKEGSQLVDLAVEDKQLETAVRVKKPFFVQHDQSIQIVEPVRHIRVHNQRNREVGHAVEGNIFRYEALKRNQVFEGCILCDDDISAGRLTKLLQVRYLQLGRARDGDYGKAEIELIDPDSTEKWQEYKVKNLAENILVITLLSDAIVRDAMGQATVEADGVIRAIEAAISCKFPSEVNIVKCFDDITYVGGFNRKWGLPLSQQIALQMGSVYVLSGVVLTPDDINQLNWYGIGERRAEGFGRVAINWLETNLMIESIDQQSDENILPVLQENTATHALATKMVQRLAHKQIESAYRSKAHEVAGPASRIPHNSQLSRLRQQIQNNPDPNELRKYLNDMKSKGANQFENCRIGNTSLRVWLDRNLTISPTEFMDELRLNNLPSLGGIQYEPSQQHTKYVLKYIDEVLALLMKKSQQE